MTPEQRSHAWQGILRVVDEVTKADPDATPYQDSDGLRYMAPGGSVRSHVIDNEDGSVSCRYVYGDPPKSIRITVQIEED